MIEAKQTKRSGLRRGAKYIAFAVLRYFVLTLSAVIILVPFLFILVSSLKVNSGMGENSIYHVPVTWIFPDPQFINYAYVFLRTNILQAFGNTILYIIPTVGVGCFCSCMAAYAFAKLRFPGRNVIFMVLLATMMLPSILTMIPSYILMSNVYQWTGTPLPIIIPGMFGSVGAIFFLRQFIIKLPSSLEEAALIDGMSRGGIFLRIILPLAKPALITQAVLLINGMYNDYLGPLLYLNRDESLWTVQLVIASNKFLISQGNMHWPRLLAANVVVIVPMFALFIAAQRYLVEGITLSGLKEG